MTKVWLNTDQDLVPGAELFRSDRFFSPWAYTVSHGQLLLRSGTDGRGRRHETTIDVLFKPMTVMKIRHGYDGLVIRCATVDEADTIKAATPSIAFSETDRLFVLETGGETDYVVGLAVGWREDVLGPTRLSFFAPSDPYDPQWPRTVFGGYDAGLDVASAEDLITSLAADNPPEASRDRYRYIYLVMTRGDLHYRDRETAAAGAFLTRTDAEDLQARIATSVDDCWIEEVPLGI
jgi:hypothetical protein